MNSGIGRIAVIAMIIGKMLMLVSICDSAFGNIGWDEGEHFDPFLILYLNNNLHREIRWRTIWRWVRYKDTRLRTHVHESPFPHWTTIFLDARNYCPLITHTILHCLHFSQTKPEFCYWRRSLQWQYRGCTQGIVLKSKNRNLWKFSVLTGDSWVFLWGADLKR